MWTGLGWPKIETGGGRLLVRKRTFRFRKMKEISSLTANQFVSQEGLCNME